MGTSPIVTFSQSLQADLQKVMDSYTALESFSLTLKNYSVKDKSQIETVEFKKCGNKYYTSGYGQISCIDGKRQIMLIPAERIAVYSESDVDVAPTDPFAMIGKLIQTAEKIELIESSLSKRKYAVFSTIPGLGRFDIWIDISLWYVSRFVQYVDESLGGQIVYEVTKFHTSCENPNAVNLNSYCTIQGGTPILTGSYKSYELYFANDYVIQR